MNDFSKAADSAVKTAIASDRLTDLELLGTGVLSAPWMHRLMHLVTTKKLSRAFSSQRILLLNTEMYVVRFCPPAQTVVLGEVCSKIMKCQLEACWVT